MSTSSAATPVRRRSRARRAVLVSAWTVPVLVLGQFALLAVVPVAVVVIGTIRAAALRAVRPWAALLAATYALPLAIWLLRPDRAPSLSKDMHPAFLVAIVAAAVTVLISTYLSSRRAPAADLS